MFLGHMNYTLGVDSSGLNTATAQVAKFHNKTSGAFSGLATYAKRAVIGFGAIGAVLATRRALQTADEYNVLQQRIATATSKTRDFAMVSRELTSISNQLGVDLQTNVSLFQALARSAPELGASSTEMLQLTKTVGQLGIIGGSSTEAMRNGLLQFTQGLSAGILRAEEMNSILENLPELANRIATGMGKNVGELRRAVIEGKVLSEDVFKALMKQSSEIDKEFQNMPLTLGRAMGALGNTLQALVGNFDKMVGSTSSLASGVQAVSNFLSQDFTITLIKAKYVARDLGGFIWHWVDAVKAVYDIFGSVYKMLSDNLSGVISGIGEGLYDVAKFINYSYSQMFINIKSFVGMATEQVKKLHTDIYERDDATAKRQMKQSDDRIAMIEEERRAKLRALDDSLADQSTAMEKEIAEYKKSLVEKSKAEQKINEENKKNALATKKIIDEKRRQAELQKEWESKKGTYEKELEQLTTALMTELEREQAHYNKSLEILKTSEQHKLATKMEYQELQRRLDQEHFEKTRRMQYLASEQGQKMQGVDALMGTTLAKKYDKIELKERGESFKNQIDQAARYSEQFFQLKKALALATALIEAPKAVLSAYTFGASMGGPILGGIFAGISAAATAVQVAAIASSQYTGRRAAGGGVVPQSAYQVNERGMEMLTMGGKDYLLTGSQRGNIIPNDKIKSGGDTYVIINNLPGQTARTQESTTADGDKQITVIIEKIENKISDGIGRGGSGIARTMEQTYGLSRVAGR